MTDTLESNFNTLLTWLEVFLELGPQFKILKPRDILYIGFPSNLLDKLANISSIFYAWSSENPIFGINYDCIKDLSVLLVDAVEDDRRREKRLLALKIVEAVVDDPRRKTAFLVLVGVDSTLSATCLTKKHHDRLKPGKFVPTHRAGRSVWHQLLNPCLHAFSVEAVGAEIVCDCTLRI